MEGWQKIEVYEEKKMEVYGEEKDGGVWGRKRWRCMGKKKMEVYGEDKDGGVWGRKRWKCMRKKKMEVYGEDKEYWKNSTGEENDDGGQGTGVKFVRKGRGEM
ncbi:hypothetical protein Pcinc_001582 [Petrolisthes cinctipes]|uniref:Uncharacterized protein n=1 Tax=Petrolisthes cinctipes TaxID=88211 RepID=A0AAE1L342_PETCI|nr:hypothetical protein Pcinc_001582 [Petrolisthes cinctipes]